MRNGAIKKSVRYLVWGLGLGCGMLACLALVITLIIGARWWDSLDGGWALVEDAPWTETVIPLPEACGQLVFLRQSAHPFLAEYNRKLRLEREGTELHIIEMPMNVGGSTFINLYWIAFGPKGHATLQLVDHWGMYVMDVEHPGTSVTHLFRTQEGEWRINGGTREETQALLDTLQDPIYMGRLDGSQGPLRFIQRDEAPEVPIDFVGDPD